jgi:uncharacterized DUF497 family protein
MGTERGHFDGLEFEWHSAKATLNRKKHGVVFEEAMTVFADERGLMVPDQLHSSEEPRSLLIGLSQKRRLLTVCFTEREPRLRLISARLAEPWERREYERGISKQ